MNEISAFLVYKSIFPSKKSIISSPPLINRPNALFYHQPPIIASHLSLLKFFFFFRKLSTDSDCQTACHSHQVCSILQLLLIWFARCRFTSWSQKANQLSTAEPGQRILMSKLSTISAFVMRRDSPKGDCTNQPSQVNQLFQWAFFAQFFNVFVSLRTCWSLWVLSLEVVNKNNNRKRNTFLCRLAATTPKSTL